jgi:hypothetical protein
MTEMARCYDCGQSVSASDLVRRNIRVGVKIDSKQRVTLCRACDGKRTETEQKNRKYAVIVWLTIIGVFVVLGFIAIATQR